MLPCFAVDTGPIIPEQTQNCHLGDTKGLTSPKDYTTPAFSGNKGTHNRGVSNVTVCY